MSDSSTLAEALSGLAVTTAPNRPRCTVGLLLERLATRDREAHDALVHAIDQTRVSAGPIASLLSDSKYDAVTGGQRVQSQTIRRHRKRQDDGCQCPWPWVA